MELLPRILSSKVRAGIFALLYGHENKEYHLRDLARRTGLAIRTIQQDIKNLQDLDLIKARRDGNRLYFRANRIHPAYVDIRALVLKTTGIVPLLSETLAGRSDVQLAFIFGSFAKGEEGAESDIDLVVVGDIGLRKLTGLLSEHSKSLGREINPHVYSRKEFVRRITEKDHFIKSVLESSKLFIVSTENELKTMGR